MSVQERQRVFAEWLKSAMPWVNARFSAEFTPGADQFKCFIGVGDPLAWRRMELEIRAAVPTGYFHGDLVSVVNTGVSGRAVCYIELSGFPLTVLRGLPTWRASYQIENPKIPTHLHFDATRFRHPISPSMDELGRLADDFEWFLQAIALGVIRRKPELGEREAAFQPRGQYLFEVEPGSGEWLQIGNEFAVRSNGLPPYYREGLIGAVQARSAGLGPQRLALLAALMRYYQLRVYEPRLEVDETGAQLPSPSLPNITARRLFDAWSRRAQAAAPGLEPARIEALLANIERWAEVVPGSSQDAYSWEVERPIDKRVILPELLASEEAAQQALAQRVVAVAPPPSPTTTPRFKLFVGGAQRGPFTVEEVAQQAARAEIDHATRAWDMRWHPKIGKWSTVGELPELAAALGGTQDDAIPDPDDGVPDPQ